VEIETLKLEAPFEKPDFVYVYFINSEVMFDGGFCSAEHAEKISEFEPKFALITHHHIDHVGYLFFSDIEAYLHPVERELIYLYEKPHFFLDRQLRICDMYGVPKEYVKTLEVISLLRLKLQARVHELKEKFGSINAIHVPGHTAGHMCFLIDNALFSGDAILSDTTPNLGLYLDYPYGLEDYLMALHRLKGLEIEVIYPAHERRINDATQRIEDLIEHYTRRTEEVLEILGEKPLSVESIAKEIKWSQGKYDSLNPFDRYLAVLETLAYLNFLKKKGLVRELGDPLKFIRISSHSQIANS
jgi:glyoxylase-like metal-dependent hydrolase (beta-lactamase superfamily II)